MDDAPPARFGAAWFTRFQLAAVLLVLLLALLVGKIWEGSQIVVLRADAGSLYHDRLMVAVDLFRLQSELHERHRALEDHVLGYEAGSGGELQFRLGSHDASLERRLSAIGETYLVEDEREHLIALRAALEEYRQAEAQALRTAANLGAKVALEPVDASFERARAELELLISIQETVGAELDRDFAIHATNVSLWLYFQLGVAFVLGLLAAWLATGLAPQRRGGGPRGVI